MWRNEVASDQNQQLQKLTSEAQTIKLKTNKHPEDPCIKQCRWLTPSSSGPAPPDPPPWMEKATPGPTGSLRSTYLWVDLGQRAHNHAGVASQPLRLNLILLHTCVAYHGRVVRVVRCMGGYGTWQGNAGRLFRVKSSKQLCGSNICITMRWVLGWTEPKTAPKLSFRENWMTALKTSKNTGSKLTCKLGTGAWE